MSHYKIKQVRYIIHNLISKQTIKFNKKKKIYIWTKCNINYVQKEKQEIIRFLNKIYTNFGWHKKDYHTWKVRKSWIMS